jgi:UDP-N-acetylmuramyl pentapeptide phosphotransferase/UDP-N-acetylglucosamine-1-phosphate transferase
METLLILPIAISFIFAMIFIPRWITRARESGLVWEDMNNLTIQKCCCSGGIMVSCVYCGSFRLLHSNIYLSFGEFNTRIFGLIAMILLSYCGNTDDLLGWKKGGLSIQFRLFLVALQRFHGGIKAGKGK